MSEEHTLEFLLAFNGRIHRLERGYWIKFEITRVASSRRRPHGLAYAFTLHGPDGRRIMGFDNAHAIRQRGYGKSKIENDHWHRTETDPGRPYPFTTAEQLVADFFAEVRRILDERGISDQVIDVAEKGEGNEDTEPRRP